MPTQEKINIVQELSEIMKQSNGIYLTDFSGLDVPAITQLRKRLREDEISYRVIKNRLGLLAVKLAGVSGLDGMLQGPTGLVYSEGDPVAPARLLTEFAREFGGSPKIKVGLIEGQVYIEDQLELLAKLPPRKILLGQVVSAVQSPLSGLAFCLNGIVQNLVGTLQALVEKRKEMDGDAPVVS